ncbi:MAG: YbaB/EbfC family nucleoid-associated protein [Patescibacteria group bacterium]|mgnify:CR=1 FL=1
MMNPFGQIGEMKKMRDEAMRIQKLLKTKMIDINKHGVFVRISADQEIQEIKTNDKSDEDVRKAVNEAIKEAQKVAAKELQSMAGGMGGLGSLLGGGK